MIGHKHKKPKKTRYFLSFVEEAVMNKAYAGYVAGRLEVTGDNEMHGKEYRFLTKKQDAFYRFRDYWDTKNVCRETLRRVLHKMKTELLEEVT